MKRRRISVLLIVAFTVVTFLVFNHERLIYPTPESESTFLRNYSPENTVKSFQLNGSSGFTHHSGAGAGREYVTRTAGFDLYFVSRTDLFTPLQEALKDDASDQLRKYDAAIMMQGFDPEGKYYFYYKLGKSVGSLKIYPVTAFSGYAHPKMPLAAGLLYTRARIEQRELWYPNAANLDPLTLLTSNQY